ncbi:glycosyltransferase [Agarivorans sp. B2Z047]|uniref:glycosyltransferase n=1 Tax=Agarivorans sp. B2Z047 TaxID=2652721 RepID=UPI00128D1DFE|nr:glycosyltransferase [Agarivorans sp. B2Z047]MPW31802.1 glycosyltransferase [Agarivorans sp. B2Z047]UQN43734.1 glycosyltransferase [Agarivorans sp. B2Z047]
MKTEIIMSVYNNIDSVRKSLQSLYHQTDTNFSLCLADDGSSDDIESLLEVFQEYSGGLQIRHVKQKDKGFRKAKILNKAINSSKAYWIIFVDSDCVFHPKFVEDHREMAKRNNYDDIITGPRVLLRDTLTKNIQFNKINLEYLYNPWRLLALSLSKKVAKPEQAIRYPKWLANRLKKPWPYGSNMSISKGHLLSVNGFDENFEGWGGEDIDLVNRLHRSGCEYQSLLGRCVQYHLEHPVREPNNSSGLTKSSLGDSCYASNGIDKL